MESNIIPTMREALKARRPAAPVNIRGPAILSVLVFFTFCTIGIALRYSTGDNKLFLLSFLVGSALSSLIYVLSKKLFRSDVGSSHLQVVHSSYDPLVGRLYGWGFDAAAKVMEDVLRYSLPMAEKRPRAFAAIDDVSHSLISRLFQLGQAKLLIGNERELKKHCEKLAIAFANSEKIPEANLGTVRVELAALELRLEKLEQISQIALIITQLLGDLHKHAQQLWEATSAEQNDQAIRDIFSIKQRASDLLNGEMAKIGF